MHTHIDPFAQTTISRYLTLSSSPLQLTVVSKVDARRAIEHGVACVPGAPFYVADADAATLRLSFALADVRTILEGLGGRGGHFK